MDLILITKDPARAAMAETAGVGRIMVDLEINGKQARQGHLNTIISGHELDDVAAVGAVLSRSDLMVRVNPVFDGTGAEIEGCLARGAKHLMLPMFTHPDEVARFLDLVAGRARTCLLLETPAALARIDAILAVPGVEEVHIGLNDLHLGLGLDFMFELLPSGLVDHCADRLRASGTKFGFGGVARLGRGDLPAEMILTEHRRIGSTQVILSRDFWQVFDEADDPAAALVAETAKLQTFMAGLEGATTAHLIANQANLGDRVQKIAARIRTAKRQATPS